MSSEINKRIDMSKIDPKAVGGIVVNITDNTPFDWISKLVEMLASRQDEWDADVKIQISYSGHGDNPKGLWEIEAAARRLDHFLVECMAWNLRPSRLEADTLKVLFASGVMCRTVFNKGAGHA